MKFYLTRFFFFFLRGSSNQLAGIALERPSTPTVSHEEVLQVGKSKAEVVRRLVERIVISLSTGVRA